MGYYENIDKSEVGVRAEAIPDTFNYNYREPWGKGNKGRIS